MFALMFTPQQRYLRTLEAVDLRLGKLLAAARALRLGDASVIQLQLAPGVELRQRRNLCKTIKDPPQPILPRFRVKVHGCVHMPQRLIQLCVIRALRGRHDLGAVDCSKNEIRRSNIGIQPFPRIEGSSILAIIDGVSLIHPHDAGGIGAKVTDSRRRLGLARFAASGLLRLADLEDEVNNTGT